MIDFKNCIRCGSKNIDKLMVNTRMKMNYPKKEVTLFRDYHTKSD